jgi:hypothetical protein
LDTLSSEDQRETTLEESDTSDGKDAEIEDAFRPYQGEQPKDALAEIFVPQIFGHSLENGGGPLDDECLWVPQTDSVSFRPLCFCVSGGYYVNLLRVKGAGLLSRHRHPGPVHGHVLKGKWSYLEHDWVAEAGSYVFEPPGEIHTLVVPEGVEEMVRYKCQRTKGWQINSGTLDPAHGAPSGAARTCMQHGPSPSSSPFFALSIIAWFNLTQTFSFELINRSPFST